MFFRPKVIAISLLILFAACSDSRLEQLEIAQKKTKSDITDLRSLIAEHTASLGQLRADVNRLTGKVDETIHSTQGKTTELLNTIEQLSSRVPPPVGVPEDLLSEDEQAIAPHSGEQAEVFKGALRLLRSGNVDGAKAEFERFLQASTEANRFSDNAYFWIGICSDKLGQTDQAITAYSNVFQKFPAEDRVPAALYRLAADFKKLGSINDSQLILQKLIDEHPTSEFARSAKEQVAVTASPKKKKKK
jgi:TolA-binding protein